MIACHFPNLLAHPIAPRASEVVTFLFSRRDALIHLPALEPYLEPSDIALAETGARGELWLGTRAVVRAVLGAALGARPQFRVAPEGKPAVEGLAFNLSHSGDFALLGMAVGGHLGVDLEAIIPTRPIDRLARRFYSAAEQQLLDSIADRDERVRRFNALWTRKEALLKAAGKGLVFPLGQWEVSVLPPPRHMLPGGPWHLADLEAHDGFAAAVAWDHPIHDIRVHELVFS